MKKYGDYITETLAAEIKAEPKTAAARQARKMGLNYIGFGRYADKKGRIAYIVDHDRLVPYKGSDEISKLYDKAYNTKDDKKSFELEKQAQTLDSQFYKIKSKRAREDQKIIDNKRKEIEKTARALRDFYRPNLFTEEEIEAIEEYTAEGYERINRYLYKGHDEGATNDHDYYLQQTIAQLDAAFEATTAPFKYTAYSGLSDRYNPDKIKPGAEYIFRGYVSASLSFDTAIDNFASAKKGKPVVLQIDIDKGQKSIYVDGVSQNSGEQETMLPRGCKIKVVSGPHKVSSAILNGDEPDDDGYEGDIVHLFQCKVVEDK